MDSPNDFSPLELATIHATLKNIEKCVAINEYLLTLYPIKNKDEFTKRALQYADLHNLISEIERLANNRLQVRELKPFVELLGIVNLHLRTIAGYADSRLALMLLELERSIIADIAQNFFS